MPNEDQENRRAGKASEAVTVGTMHLAKGLEFRAVAVAACDGTIIQLRSSMEGTADSTDLADAYDAAYNAS